MKYDVDWVSLSDGRGGRGERGKRKGKDTKMDLCFSFLFLFLNLKKKKILNRSSGQ
jgi:hypothetical protein